MTIEIKREEIDQIFKHLSECKAKLKQGNVHPCLISFKSALEKTLSTHMLPSDEKELMEEVDSFLQALSESKNFKDIFGPVSFQARDLSSSLDFVKQLIQVEEEKLREDIDFSQKNDGVIQDIATNMEMEAKKIMDLIDIGEHARAKELIADNDILVTFIVQMYNKNGIRLRKEGAYDNAISEFEKALVILPDDEGIHYNIARVLVAKNEWKLAEASVIEALKINPAFKEGNDLLKHIRLNS